MSFGGNKRRWDGISLTLPAFLCYLQVLGVRVFLSPTFMVGGGERTREHELYEEERSRERVGGKGYALELNLSHWHLNRNVTARETISK